MQKKKTKKVQVRDLKPAKNAKGGEVNLSDFPFTHPIDKSTPVLYQGGQK